MGGALVAGARTQAPDQALLDLTGGAPGDAGGLDEDVVRLPADHAGVVGGQDRPDVKVQCFVAPRPEASGGARRVSRR